MHASQNYAQYRRYNLLFIVSVLIVAQGDERDTETRMGMEYSGLGIFIPIAAGTAIMGAAGLSILNQVQDKTSFLLVDRFCYDASREFPLRPRRGSRSTDDDRPADLQKHVCFVVFVE